MSILQEIIQHKIVEVAEASKHLSLNQLRKRQRTFPLLDFREALTQPGLQIIAEIKIKSPSVGDIQPAAKPVDIAKQYEENGAAAISILTDKKYFGGNLEFLRRIKATVSLPLLRKDFIISEYQVYESYVAGADAILLIADAVDTATLTNLYGVARRLGLAVLLEVYSKEALSRVKNLKPEIMGVNSRDLSTMETDLNRCKGLFPLLHPSCLKVAESGIQSNDDLRFISDIGFHAALVGTTLMKSTSPGESLSNLLKGLQP